MTLNPPSFLPPVLAVGAGSSPNGRQSLGSGLVTHRGILEANSFRANGYIWPQSGRGTELGFQSVAPYGFLQVIDRDTTTWLDLNLTAKNIVLNPQSGGKVSLPAGTAQQQLGAFHQLVSWGIPAANAWYESPVQLTVTTTGGLIRLEACGNVSHGVAGALIHVGLMIDGNASVYDTLTAAHLALAGSVAPYSVVAYSTPIAGVHRFSVMLYTTTTGGSMWNGSYQSLYVTEQRA